MPPRCCEDFREGRRTVRVDGLDVQNLVTFFGLRGLGLCYIYIYIYICTNHILGLRCLGLCYIIIPFFV